MAFWGAGVTVEMGRSERNQYVFLKLLGKEETKDDSHIYFSSA